MKASTLKQLAVSYLAFPVLLFFMGWLQVIPAALACAALLFAVVKTLRALRSESLDEAPLFTRSQGIILGLLCLTWVLASGIGGYTHQNQDFNFRNAVHHDLISFNWPVSYPSNPPSYLLYYHSFWLPSALLGKLAGWEMAKFALYLWSVLGVFLTLGLFVANVGRYTHFIIIVFILFSGHDIVGHILHNHWIPPIGKHIEWWDIVCQYSSNTTALFWVFNQALPTWIVTLLIMHKPRLDTLGFLSCLIIPFAPLPAMGLAVLAGTLVLTLTHYKNLPGLLSSVRLALSPINVIGGLPLIIIFYLYFRNNVSVNEESGWLIKMDDPLFMFTLYVKFLIIEFGLLLAFFWKEIKWDALMLAALASLIVIPLYKAGGSNDLCMRASLPGLTVLCVAISRALAKPPEPGKRGSRLLQIAALCVAWVTPLMEISRVAIVLAYNGPYEADKVGSVNPGQGAPPSQNNFVTVVGPTQRKQQWLFKY